MNAHRSDFFGNFVPAPSSGLNVHRLRAMLASPHFVADCAAHCSERDREVIALEMLWSLR